jgi:hypothetical protein
MHVLLGSGDNPTIVVGDSRAHGRTPYEEGCEWNGCILNEAACNCQLGHKTLAPAAAQQQYENNQDVEHIVGKDPRNKYSKP